MLLLLLACTGKTPDDSSTADDTGPDTADSGDTGASSFLNLTAAPADDIPTVVRVTWSTAEATEGWVTYAPKGEADPIRVTATGTTDHEALLFGLAPETTYTVNVGADNEVSAPIDVTTGERPRDLPDLTAYTVTDEAAPGFFAVGMVSASSIGAIVDHDGNYVWWYRIPDATNYVTRVLRSVDGRSVLVNSAPAAGDDDSAQHRVYRVSYDGSEVETIELPLHHHDYCELPDGSIGFLAFDYQTVDGARVNGDKLMERAPDGTVRQIWSAWDWYDYADYQDTSAGTEFVHANVVKYDAATDSYIVGLRNVGGLVRIDRDSGEITEHLGGNGSDYTFTTGTPLSGQHSFTMLDDGFVVLDNRDDTDEPSRAAQFRLSGGTMEEVWSYTSPAGYHEFGLGDAVRMPSGNTKIVWSSSGELNEVTPEGELIWKLNLDVGTGFGYGDYTEDPQVLP